MSTAIKDLNPKAIWENFYKLTQVPRPSEHEEKARIFMLNWAEENHIEAKMDEAGNIIMSKPATPGMISPPIRYRLLWMENGYVPKGRHWERTTASELLRRWHCLPLPTFLTDRWKC